MKLKRPFLLPVAASLGVHALLLFGFAKPVPPPPVEPDEPVLIDGCFVLVVPPEDDPVTADDYPGPREEQPQSVPTLPELPPTRKVDIDLPVQRASSPVVPFDGPATTVIPSVWTGGGEGSGSGGPPAFPAHLLDNPPQVRYRVAPVYPFEAKRSGEMGEVVVEFLVNERGEVVQPRVVSSSATVFEEPTLRAVARWKFEPGRKDGRTVRFRMSVPVRFNLNE
jgi:protein TonB